MNLFEWYLNLSLWQAVLVWLKLLLPVLFGLVVFGLIFGAYRVFAGSLKLPPLAQNIQPKRLPKSSEKSVG